MGTATGGDPSSIVNMYKASEKFYISSVIAVLADETPACSGNLRKIRAENPLPLAVHISY